MARLVVHTATTPKKVPASDKDIYACMCGLSKNKPFCDGSHKTLPEEKEGELRAYDADGEPLNFEGEEPFEDDEFEGGCCGGHCQNHEK